MFERTTEFWTQTGDHVLAFPFPVPHRTELTTIFQPEPGPGDVLVRVSAAVTPT